MNKLLKLLSNPTIGRLSGLQYIIGQIIPFSILFISVLLIFGLGDILTTMPLSNPSFVLSLVLILISLVIIILFLASLVLFVFFAYLLMTTFTRRLHDIGISAWWIFGLDILFYIVGLLMGAHLAIAIISHLILAIIPGQKSENKYGGVVKSDKISIKNILLNPSGEGIKIANEKYLPFVILIYLIIVTAIIFITS